ncbi:MAG: nuclear transport factor 2 family protein [Proteobacteria bacterium]|nr:nuclear transport factor 2 family protein [Pseudomonadota bacterium]
MRCRKFMIATACVVLLMGLVSPVSAGSVTEDSIRAYYAAWTSGDVDKIMAYFNDSIVYADMATGARSSGTTAVREFVQKFVDGYPGVQLVPASITIGPASAAVEWVMSGGSGSEAWSVPGVCVFNLDGEKFSTATDYWNKE